MVSNLFHRLSLPVIILGLVVGSLLLASAFVSDARAQMFSGRGVDMRALQGQAADCRRPALQLQQRVIVLRQSIRDILQCNASGGLFQRDGSCVPAVSPMHIFEADRGPGNEDALSFNDADGNNSEWALIGGADGDNITCEPIPSCTYDGIEYGDGDTITLYERSSRCDEACIPRVFTCDGDQFVPPVSGDLYETPGTCPLGPCDGCANPCLEGAIIENGKSLSFVYQDGADFCGADCESTSLACSNGDLADPWWGEDFVCECPNCGGCPADTLTWTDTGGNYTCEGDVPSADDGDSETADNTLPGLTGSADFTCEGEEWGLPANASCEPVGPENCPADTLEWTVDGNSCSGTVIQTSIGDNDTADDNTGSVTGSATFPCESDGTWGNPTSASCVSEGPWTEGPWSSCSETCGGGIQTRTVTCDFDSCTGPEPETTRACNEDPCGGACGPRPDDNACENPTTLECCLTPGGPRWMCDNCSTVPGTEVDCQAKTVSWGSCLGGDRTCSGSVGSGIVGVENAPVVSNGITVGGTDGCYGFAEYTCSENGWQYVSGSGTCSDQQQD